MKYTDYQASRDLAWEILIREGITELPVSVMGICRNLGIDVMVGKIDGSGYCEEDANGRLVIAISSDDPPMRQRFTAAHELGHILMGHTDKYHVAYRDPSPTDDPKEQAVNVFAARLLAPAIVLRDLGVTNSEQIADICKISMQAAEYRMDRLQDLYDREKRFLIDRGHSCFGMSPLERKVEKQFHKYIRKNRL